MRLNSPTKLVANPNMLLRHPTHRLCHIGASGSAVYLPRSLIPLGTPVAGLHTLGLVMAPQEEKKTKPKSDTHGSVLMEMIKSQDQPPMQLTVGDKGTYDGGLCGGFVNCMHGTCIMTEYYPMHGQDFCSDVHLYT